MKKNLFYLFMLTLVLILAACGSNESSNNANKTPADNDKLIVGSTPTGPPYTFQDINSENVEGIMVDIMNEVAKKLEKEVEYKAMPFSTLIPSLTGNKIDVISAGMIKTEEREKEVSFSDIVFGFGEGLIVSEDNNEIKQYTDLKDKVVGVQKGTIYNTHLEESGLPKEIKVYESTGDLLQEVSNGRLDAAIADQPILVYLKEQNSQFKVKVIDEYEPQQVGEVGLIIQKGNSELLDEINNVISELKDEGSLQKVYDKWNVSWE